jgi:putative membrane protein
MFLLAQADGSVSGTGFLPGARGSFMLDFVTLAMFGILLVLAYSIYLVKYRRQYEWHKRIQLILAVVLLVAVVAFEVDVRWFTDWKALARPSRFWSETGFNAVWIALSIHLCFAIPTPFLWGWVIYEGLRKFPRPTAPSAHSLRHRRWGWVAALGMLLTSVTGWVFYVMAFVL